MKKILFILFPIFSFGQITISTTPEANYNYSSTGVGSINSQTYTVGKFYLLIYLRLDDAGTPADFSVSGTSSTWTEIANSTGITTGAARARLKVWRYAPTSTVTESLSFTGAAFAEGTIVVLFEITGVITTGSNGADAIVQIVTDEVDAGTDPTITMSALNGTKNTVLAFFGNNVNPFGSTPESGWTELSEGGFTLPTTGGVFIKRNATTDNTPSVTASSSDWMGVAIELRSNHNRIMVIN